MLDIPDRLGLSHTEQQQVHDQWNTFDRVQAQLKQEGFVPLAYPPYACPGYLDIDTLTSHDSRTLTVEYAKYKSWHDFTAQRLMYSEQILLQTSNEMGAIEAEVKTRLAQESKKKYNKDDIREEARKDQRYAQLRLQEQEHKQLKFAYESEKERYSKSMSLISRAITLRGQDIDQGQRGSNIGASATKEFG
jgi:hypothetical protein